MLRTASAVAASVVLVFASTPPAVAAPAGPTAAVVQRPVISAAGWRYLPYERTYGGLPVVGGDYVVVVDPSGRVRSRSDAHPAPLGDLDIRPRITQATAERTAAGRLPVPGTVKGSRLVIDATAGAPKLVWESVVAGPTAVLTVDVDARSGAVLRAKDAAMHDTGHAGLNGGVVNVDSALINCPEPGNCPDQHTWILGHQSGGGLTCDAPKLHRTDPEPLEWGDGDPTSAETACVDMMFDADTENAMLWHWLGRNGMDNNGANHGFAMFTCDCVDDSYFVPGSIVSQQEVHIGHSPTGVYWATLDVVGHENGHGIDDHTPGGVSRNGTAEFIADAFGTATEWYANEHAPYDTPDYVILDNPIVGAPTSLKRFMYNPQLDGHTVNCYSDNISSIDDHAAAGVGDHWFYLLAEGSNPSDGQPASPTCNGGTVSGVGIQRTMQILYHAMLMKNSNSSYQMYRLWTLTAANNLFPGDCATLTAVRAAWDGAGVPIQTGEPSACVPNVVGAAQDDAVNAIRAAGLSVGSITEQGSNAPEGTVLAQSPGSGSVVTEGTRVNLTVAAFVVAVPDVVGHLRNDAVNIIRAAGLNPSVTTIKDCSNPQAVLDQSPAAGTGAIRGSTVHLTVDGGTIKTCKFP